MESKKQISYFLSVLFCLCNFLIFSQEELNKAQLFKMLSKNQPDSSLIDIYNELCWPIYANENLDSAKLFGAKAITLSNKIKDLKRECVAHRRLGIAYVNSGFYKEAINEQSISLNIAKIIKFKRGEQLALNNIGVAYLDNELYNKALTYFLEALKIAEKEKDYYNTANLHFNCGIIYKEIKNYYYAKQAFLNSIYFSKTFNDSAFIATSNIKLSSIYRELKQDSSTYYSNQAYIYSKSTNDKFFLIAFFINKGLIYDQKNKYDSSIYVFKQALASASKINDLVTINSNIGLMYKKLNIVDSSHYYFYLAYKKSIENRLINSILDLSLEMALFHFNKKDLKNYHFYVSSYLKYSDTVIIENNTAQIARQRLEFDFEKQEITNKVVVDQKNAELKLNKISLQAKEKQKWFLIAGILLLAVIGALLFYQGKNRKKTNKKLQLLNSELEIANKTKARFFSILNHDLRSPVSNLIHFLHLQKEHPELLTGESKTRLESKIIHLAEQLLVSMEDILIWSKGQMENFKIKNESIAIDELFQSIKQHFLSEEKTTIVFEMKELLTINCDINYLKTIMRNLTSNAIKATADVNNATITWKAWQENDKMYLSIADNGIGVNDEKLKALYDDTQITGIQLGLGLHLIRDMAKLINCTITLHANQLQGTKFVLKII